MANQPKRYKKFVATAATATLVASAIAPVASASFKDVADNNDHKKNIEAIAELGYMGAGDNFRPSENVTRGQVAIILANWAQDVAGLEVPADYKTVQRFKDVPLTADDKLLQSAALVKDYGIFEGSNGNLNGANPISREHMALVLNKAFEAVNGTSLLDLAGDTSDVTFADEAKINKNYLPVVKALKKLGITAPASFNPSGNVTRGQFATFFIQTNNQEVEFNVASVSAINEKTLEVTGTALKSLTAEDITVENNSVESITVSNGTATVKLVSALVPSKDTKVTIKKGETTKEFVVKYEIPSVTVELVEKTYDDDLANQTLEFKVNGQKADADYLALAGYTVNFVATDKDNIASADTLFATASNTSTTGKLDTGLTAGEDFEVEIQILKDGKAVVSDKGIIKIRNIEASTTSIDEVKFALDKDAATQTYNADDITDLTGTDFLLNSKTIVAGEAFYVNQAKVTTAGDKIIAPQANVKVKTSNPAVISVASGVLTAEAAGTATITVEVGDTKKDFTFTVTNKERKLTTVKPATASVKVVKGKTAELKVETFDQYGDPFAVVGGTAAAAVSPAVAVDEIVPEVLVSGTPTPIVTGTDVVSTTVGEVGVATLTLSGDQTGKGTVYFKDKDSKVLGSVFVEVTEVNNVGSQKLEIRKPTNTATEKYSNDTTIDMLDDNTIRFALADYTTQNVYTGDRNLTTDLQATPAAYSIEVVDPKIAYAYTASNANATQASPVAPGGTDDYFEIKGIKAGTTDILVKDSTGFVVAKTTVTIVNNAPVVKSATWKTVPTINFVGKVVTVHDVLDITASNGDDIVNGLTLTSSTNHKVRIVEGVGATQGELYIDADGNGAYTVGEHIVGKVTASVATGAAGVTITDIFAGSSATAVGHEGTIIFKISVDEDNSGIYDANEGVSSTSVTIDLKQ